MITQPIVNTNLTISKWYNGKPKVYIMSAGKQYENIVIGHENNIWGGNPNSINSHKNVNEGDIDIFIGDVEVCRNGIGVLEDETEVTEVLKKDEIKITIDLKMGHDDARVWGCDLTHEYVTINADYRS